MKLEKKKKTKWIKALRSGKYKQGQGQLKATVPLYNQYEEIGHEQQFCCLGVACQIRIARAHKNDNEAFASETFLPMETQKTLASMNDEGVSFKAIAKWIEKNL